MNSVIKYALVVAGILCMSALPLYANEADDKIEATFKGSYVYVTYLQDDAIKVDSDDGVVTLTGTVKQDYHKTLAEDTAANLPGVVRVDNKLALEGEADAEKSDKWIDRKVNLNLLLHRNVSASKTTVSVKDGIVTLTGEASSMAQKDLTTEYAMDIDGVKSVDNQMTIKEPAAEDGRTLGEKLDDASITAQVKTALWNHRSTSAMATKVSTHEGEVTLTGVAKNAAEKALVTKIVSDIQGVTDVDNDMTVEEDAAK